MTYAIFLDPAYCHALVRPSLYIESHYLHTLSSHLTSYIVVNIVRVRLAKLGARLIFTRAWRVFGFSR